MPQKIKIVLTGAESTGKSTLTKQIAKHYNTIYLPEYARSYVEQLDRKYTYEDVEKIAKKQINLEAEFLKKTEHILFVDTSLIITKVWFEVVYNKIPLWFLDKMNTTFANFYLLCTNDLKWQADNVRENNGEMRNILFEKYYQNLVEFNLNFEFLSGNNNKRLENAISLVDNFMKQL